jgi:hypothetical protein
MTDESQAETLRRDIARYRYLLDYLRDTSMRAHLEKLLNEAQNRLAEIDPDRRS